MFIDIYVGVNALLARLPNGKIRYSANQSP